MKLFLVRHAKSEPRKGWRTRRDGTRLALGGLHDAQYRAGRAVALIPIIHLDSPAQLASARRRYALWWQALESLASLEFRHFDATGPRAPRAPWEG